MALNNNNESNFLSIEETIDELKSKCESYGYIYTKIYGFLDDGTKTNSKYLFKHSQILAKLYDGACDMAGHHITICGPCLKNRKLLLFAFAREEIINHPENYTNCPSCTKEL